MCVGRETCAGGFTTVPELKGTLVDVGSLLVAAVAGSEQDTEEPHS